MKHRFFLYPHRMPCLVIIPNHPTSTSPSTKSMEPPCPTAGDSATAHRAATAPAAPPRSWCECAACRAAPADRSGAGRIRCRGRGRSLVGQAVANGDAQKKPWDLLNLLQFFFWVVKIKKLCQLQIIKLTKVYPELDVSKMDPKWIKMVPACQLRPDGAEGFHQPEALPP